MPGLKPLPMLIFDLDGTLWDSAQAVAESWNIAFSEEHLNRTFTTGDIHRLMGKTMAEIRGLVMSDIPDDVCDRLFRRCTEFEVEYVAEHGGEIYSGLRDVLGGLKDSGWPLAIVSNCQLGYISAFLSYSGTGDLFCDWEEWERTRLSKGENVRLVMQRNGVQHAVYIGDTEKDEEAARTAGIPFIHAAYGFGTAAAPDGVIRSLYDLPAEAERISASLIQR